MLSITYTERFKKHYKKLTVTEQNQFKQKIRQFVDQPLLPSLRVKKIQGSDGLFEFSVNMDIRVIWFYEGTDIIALIDIGHHDILKKY